jgi:hypothetical protein
MILIIDRVRAEVYTKTIKVDNELCSVSAASGSHVPVASSLVSATFSSKSPILLVQNNLPP